MSNVEQCGRFVKIPGFAESEGRKTGDGCLSVSVAGNIARRLRDDRLPLKPVFRRPERISGKKGLQCGQLGYSTGVRGILPSNSFKLFQWEALGLEPRKFSMTLSQPIPDIDINRPIC